MTRRLCAVLWIALSLVAAACGSGGAGGSTSPASAGEPDWGTGMPYSDCRDQGLTEYGLRTGQKWIGDFHADLYECRAPSTPAGSTSEPAAEPAPPPTAAPGTASAPILESTTTQTPGTTTTLPPLRGLRYEPVYSDVRAILDDEYSMPLQIVGRPGGRYSYMITREGRVWIMEEDTFSNPPVLDLRDSIAIGSETGLLGMALHPDDPRRMFLHYTDLEFDIIIAEYRLDDTLRTAVPSSARILMDIPTRSDFHKGGMLAFGPDGYLYIGVGDDGFEANGQNSATLFASVLRIDVDRGNPYSAPSDHPPVNPEAPEVYVYGIRNPWRFWIDPVTNLIYIGDVGADAFEEIDIVSLGTPGANFGWSILEGHDWGPWPMGRRCREDPGTCDTSGYIPPALVLPHDSGACAVVGGVVYRGRDIPELHGHYFYSDVCQGFLRSFRWDGALAVDPRDWTSEVGTLTQFLSFGVDTQGEMYALTANDVLRIVPVR